MNEAGQDSGTVLVQRLLVHWRVRCVLRRAPIEATAGSAALDLCAAVVTTLERGSPPPGLARAVRTWGAGLRGPDQAIAAAQCLSEITTELAADVFDQFPAVALEPVLEVLATEAAVASARLEPRPVASSSPYPDRKALERDLDDAVATSLLSDGELSLAVIELDAAPKGSLHRPHRPETDDAGVLALGAALAAAGPPQQRIYRISRRKLAVLAPGTHTVDLGALALEATLALGVGFSWGMAGLRASGSDVLASPDVLLMLAEADLHFRRRDFVHARHMLARHRRRSALASVSAALVLLAGTAFGLGAFHGASPGQGQLAAPVRLGGLPPIPSSGGPSVQVPPSPQSGAPNGGHLTTSNQAPVVPTVSHVAPTVPSPPTSILPPLPTVVPPPPPPSPPASLTGTVRNVAGVAKGLVRKVTGGLPPGVVNASTQGKGHLTA